MDNQPTNNPRIITAYNLKQALLSVLIGTAIWFLTTLLQTLLDLLQGVQPQIPGAAAGMVKYWRSWKYNHFV